MYEGGRGVSKDVTQAIAWYRKAAEQGDAEAKENLAKLTKDSDPAHASTN
jgi:TPR repeat protein